MKPYFRLEWTLAEERAQRIAKGVPFIVPIVVDDTTEAGASVPDAFLRSQWTRLPKGVPSPQFVEQVERLLGQSRKPAPGKGPAAGDPSPPRVLPSKSVWRTGLAVAVLALGVGIVWWQAARRDSRASLTAGPPVVVLMDSPSRDRVYDPETLKNGGSNADDITDVLHDLPITLVKEATSRLWRRENEILKQHPALIVIHRTCFYDFEAAEVPVELRNYLRPAIDSKLVAFLGYTATVSPQTKFIVYSRGSWEVDSVAAQWRAEAALRFPALNGKIETWRVPLDRATFRNPLTSRELKDSVEKALGLKVVSPTSGR